MTEQDVLEAYQPILIGLIHKYCPYTPFDDELSTAQLELLLALRCYCSAYHGTFWTDFACQKVCTQLKELQKQQNSLQRYQRISLDAPISDESCTTFGQLFLTESPKVTRIELQEMLSHAPQTAQQVAWRVIDKCSPAEILNDLQISPSEYQRRLCMLQKAWEAYNQES